MSTVETTPPISEQEAAGADGAWNWHPSVPIEYAPLYSWPINFAKISTWFALSWFPMSVNFLVAMISVATWFYTQPALERCVSFEFGWIFQIFARNLMLLVLVAGGLHLYFHKFKKQGTELKYDKRELVKNNRTFTLRNQVVDNMIWSCASGVTLWTAYEVLFMWAYANEMVPFLEWRANPVWFVAMFFLMPLLHSFHFYWVHRLLHWKPLYAMAHSLHHRNVSVGPWSGFSMHPIEHVLYLSSVLIHWVIASHPLHVMFHLQYLALTAASSHTGFESVLVKDKKRVYLSPFFHQLHHRFFECNYGTAEMPWDQWFGTFHNGTKGTMKRIRDRTG
jgi:sterol desaturase/sphingolipid hydroxylase (fatty acid hydroxylase superfamily)